MQDLWAVPGFSLEFPENEERPHYRLASIVIVSLFRQPL